MSELGHLRHFDRVSATSGLPRTTDIIRPARLVRFVPQATRALQQTTPHLITSMASNCIQLEIRIKYP
jgi:hypothetical protein